MDIAETLKKEKEAVKNLKKLVSKVYGISRAQALFLLRYFGEKKPEEELSNLLLGNILFESKFGTISSAPIHQQSENTTYAVWVLFKYISKITFDNVYLAQSPSSLFFTIDDEMYEVVIVRQDSEKIIARQLSLKKPKGVHYIALVFGMEQLETFFQEASQYPDLSVKFLLWKGAGEDGVPIIYTMEKEEA